MRHVSLFATLIMMVVGNTPIKVEPMGEHCLMATRLLAQEGNPGHKEPPPGAICNGHDEAKPCACHRECKESDELDEMGEPTGRKRTDLVEDPKCSYWCYKEHCHCTVHNCE